MLSCLIIFYALLAEVKLEPSAGHSYHSNKFGNHFEYHGKFQNTKLKKPKLKSPECSKDPMFKRTKVQNTQGSKYQIFKIPRVQNTIGSKDHKFKISKVQKTHGSKDPSPKV